MMTPLEFSHIKSHQDNEKDYTELHRAAQVKAEAVMSGTNQHNGINKFVR